MRRRQPPRGGGRRTSPPRAGLSAAVLLELYAQAIIGKVGSGEHSCVCGCGCAQLCGVQPCVGAAGRGWVQLRPSWPSALPLRLSGRASGPLL
jgi:hypothetical protein